MSCPPVLECCDGVVPKTRYYATFTNVGAGPFGFGCDCVPSIVVPLDLYATGDYTNNPNCPGCKTGERWYEWVGEATHAGCFAGVGQLRFCVRMDCDPAGISFDCGGFVVYASIECADPTAPACDYIAGVTPIPMKPPPDCSCNPLHLVSTASFVLGSAGCCRDIAGDAVAGIWTLEITE